MTESTELLGGLASEGSFVVKFDPNGNVIAGYPSLAFADFATAVYSLTVSPQGTLGLAGNFTHIAEQPASGLAITTPGNAWLSNLSTLASVPGPPQSPVIAGFSLAGTAPKTLLFRGVGPALAAFGVVDPIPSAFLSWFDSAGNVLGENSVWNSGLAATMASVGAFPLPPNSGNAALAPSVTPGQYTVQVASGTGVPGNALLEIYDTAGGNTPNRLVNLSSLGSAGTTAGFVIGGTTNETLLLRAVGPDLAKNFGNSNALPNPILTLYDSSGQIIAQNIGWNDQPVIGSSAVAAGVETATSGEMAAVGAFSLTAGSADDAMLVSVPPGAYTMQLTASGDTAGQALLEIYEIPQ